MAEAAVSGRPKTLEEAKEFLRERVATRRSPKLAHTHRQYLRAAVCWGGRWLSERLPQLST